MPLNREQLKGGNQIDWERERIPGAVPPGTVGKGQFKWKKTNKNSYDTKIRVENKPGRRGSEERERKKQEREEEEEEGRGWMEGEVVNGEERRENVRNQRIDTSRGTRDGNTGMGKGKERESRPVKWSSLPD